MKKIFIILQIALGVWFLDPPIFARDVSGLFKNFTISSLPLTLLGFLGYVAGSLLIIGGIGSLLRKSWSKNLSIAGIVIGIVFYIVLVYIFLIL